MKRILLTLLPFLLLAACQSDDDVTPPGPETAYDGYTLVWNEEFDDNISSDDWNFELGDGTDYGLPPGWGNNELQIYTSSSNNAFIQPDEEGNSVLAIIAREEAGDNYTSAKLTTQNLHSFRFGRIEARIKVPTGQGIWPAFWLLGDNISEVDWPGCGEIDVMEVIGSEPTVSHSTVHYTDAENKAASNGESLEVSENLGDDYHLYRVDWTPDELVFSLDEQIVNQVPIEDDMKEFLRSFYIIFNVAVGGNWPGYPDETTEFPQRMQVDWVRVYSKDGFTPPAAPPLDIDEESLGSLSGSLPQHAFNSSFNQFDNLVLNSFGAGGEPVVTTSDQAIEGDSSLLFSFPGGNWGGGFFEQEPTVDATQYAGGNLRFSLQQPADLADIEIKLESIATSYSVFLKDYTGEDIGNGFTEYTIPLADFIGLDLSDLKIPFALWNPMDSSEEFWEGEVILDNVYFEE